MLAIRLSRVGKKKFPTYKLVVSEKTKDTHDVYNELLGTYNPHAKENQFIVKADRVMFWIGKGAQASDTVHNLLVANGVLQGDKKKSVFLSKKRKAKTEEKNKAKAAKKAESEKKAADKKAAEAEAAAAKKEADLAAAAEAKAAAEAAKEAAKAEAEKPAEVAPEAPAQA